MLKRIAFFWAVIALLSVILPTNTAFAGEKVGSGQWDSRDQGIRFSIYDLDEQRTVSVLDVFREDDLFYTENFSGDYLEIDGRHYVKCTPDCPNYNHDPKKSDKIYDLFYHEALHGYRTPYTSPAYVVANIGVGCKLEYLNQYYVEGKEFGDIPITIAPNTNIDDLGLTVDRDFLYKEKDPSTTWSFTTVDDDTDQKFLWECIHTIYTVGDGAGRSEWVSNGTNLREMFNNNDIAVIETYILNQLGFYIENGLGKENGVGEYFDLNYVLVMGPLMTFRIEECHREISYYDGRLIKWKNKHGWHSKSERYYFYGTATEWAMLDYYYMNHDRYVCNHTGKNNICYAFLNYTMGSLTKRYCPLGVLTQTNKEFLVGGAEYDEDGKAPKGQTIEIKSPLYEEIETSVIEKDPMAALKGGNVAEIYKKVFLYYGVDTMRRKDFGELTVDLVETNTTFRTGTKCVLSFKIESDGKLEYAPDYDSLVGGGEYYGIKLSVITMKGVGSGNIMPNMDILCDGLPSSITEQNKFASPRETIAYTEFQAPYTPGVWKFRLEVNSNRSGTPHLESYHSNTGERVRLNSKKIIYEYQVTFVDDTVQAPPDAYSSAVMPKDFETPQFDITSKTSHAPATSASWTYYKAYPHEDDEGNKSVILLEHTDTAEAKIADGYAPLCYGNLPKRIKNGELYLRSGYGFGAEVSYESSAGYGFQSGAVLIPEYGHAVFGMQLEKQSDNRFYMQQNENSMYYNDELYSKYSRVHFTPVWYPDGEYEIAVFLFDSWTPVGQLWDYRVYTIHIDGTLYDDWYITRT